jgi:hypothetical protein
MNISWKLSDDNTGFDEIEAWMSSLLLTYEHCFLCFLSLQNAMLSQPRAMTINLTTPEPSRRQRRAHQKSRLGCGNCKLRRVKCDETYPRCRKCASFSVDCDYDSTCNELQLAMSGTGVFEAPQGPPVSFHRLVLSMINAPLKAHSPNSKIASSPVYELRLEDLEVVSRFQSRTVLTIGTKESVHVYQREWFKVACEHPMFMHVILAMTLMHDRYLAGFSDTPQYNEAYHHYQATAMFNRKLTNHTPYEKDALWAAAALLSAMSFGDIDARTYEQAWPLKAPSESDLSWLRMTDGKKAVWKLVDPMREGSIIKEAWQQFTSLRPARAFELATCPTSFELDSLKEYATSKGTPCGNAASSLIPLLTMDCNYSTIAKYLSFPSHVGPQYMRLLSQKDPVALLLLGYWYAKMCSYNQWWVQPRAVLECQAICVYLVRYHSEEEDILGLLRFPRMMSGLVYG